MAKYCKGFPDPSVNPSTSEGGWKQFDFKGVTMQDKADKELEDMHGAIKLRFDQTELAERRFPYFVVGMGCGVHSTLALVMRGEEYFTTPVVRMGYHLGMDNEVFECEYTEKTCEHYAGIHVHV